MVTHLRHYHHHATGSATAATIDTATGTPTPSSTPSAPSAPPPAPPKPPPVPPAPSKPPLAPPKHRRHHRNHRRHLRYLLHHCPSYYHIIFSESGLERLSRLTKLEKLDLSQNTIGNDIFAALGALTSLKVLHLANNNLEGYFPALGMFFIFHLCTYLIFAVHNLQALIIMCFYIYFKHFTALENLEILDINNLGYYGALKMQGFEQISMLKKLKILNLGRNDFNKSLLTSLSVLPLLKSLDLHSNSLFGSFPAQELSNLTNLEELDLRYTKLNDTPSVEDCKMLSRLEKLKNIALGDNGFNNSIILCLSALPSLTTLDLSYTQSLGSYFPIQGMFITTKTLFTKRLPTKHLPTIAPFSLILYSFLCVPLYVQIHQVLICRDIPFSLYDSAEPSHLPNLEVLFLSDNRFNGTLPMEALASFHRLEVLDVSYNRFVGSIPSTIQALSSLRVISFAHNEFNGSLPNHGLCELNNLHELDLSQNMLSGSLPLCFNHLSSLKLLDISSNQFTGIPMPLLIANLTSLEYIDFSNNKFEGSFAFSSFSNLKKLEVVRFVCHSDKFMVETEEPTGWIPMFQLKVLVLSSCAINGPTRSVVPRFLLHQRELVVLDLSHNSLEGHFPNWLIENNTMLKALILRNNSFSGIILMPLRRNANTRWLDMSENHMNGTIPHNFPRFLPCINHLNMSRNSLDGVIPPSIGDLSKLETLDLSDNELSGQVPKGLFTFLRVVNLSKNKLHGKVLSGNTSLGLTNWLDLDNNYFTGKIGNYSVNELHLWTLDISNNFFTGMIPDWMTNNMVLSELVVSNNRLEGRFPCGIARFSYLDISHNSFSGPIPYCSNFQDMENLDLGSNRFTGLIPNVFRNLTSILSLDIGNNFLSGRIPEFLGDLSFLRVLILRKNNFSGSIPKQLCLLSNLSMLDLSSNSLSGSIPRCLQNIISPIKSSFMERDHFEMSTLFYNYGSVEYAYPVFYMSQVFLIQDEVQFTVKTQSRSFKGRLLDLMVGLDLSCNNLVGEIPKELGLLTQIHSLNLSHNQLTGTIPMQFSNLENMESLDLSYNRLRGEVPSSLIQLNFLAIFNVSHNNLSGRLPDMKAQFSTYTNESYEGNPLLCGLPLEKKCTSTSHVTDPSDKQDLDKWYDIDMTSFYGSSGATWVVFLLGWVAVLYINPYWRRRWLDLVEERMYACYYFLDDSVRKVSMLFRK
ncbi:hypothetical protein OSB04_005311 [Centaurea solstitialis]|uniref:Uncharacterized protein n=1 Tax=Centaurea solstitialis TaxID=347529 RepID=A0AA38WS12_9ASTR|nr:hypothetical protein OSB04_005311 [Centaurea solstitialis]